MLADPWQMFISACLGAFVVAMVILTFGVTGWWLAVPAAVGALIGAWLGSSPP